MKEEAFVVSDLHLGAGQADPQLEDFGQDANFAQWLQDIARPGVTLFINGDFIDFPQIPPYDLPTPLPILWTEYEIPAPNYLLWDEEVSIEKVNTATRAHSECFNALREFVACGGQLRIIIGNHDLDFAWPAVQHYLRSLLGDPSVENLRFTLTAERYHGVLIEHGHAFTPENATKNPSDFIHEWPKPGTSADAPTKRYLERVWSTDFMLRFYNDIERTHPYADKIKPMVSVLYHGMKNGWIGGGEIVKLVLFLKSRGIPFGAILSTVLGDEKVALHHVIGAFEEEEWRHTVVERMRHDRAFTQEIDEALAKLSPGEQELLRRNETVQLGVQSLSQSTDKSASTLGFFRDSREVRAAKERLGQEGITHVVFGHTHTIVDGELEGCLFNPGTWLPFLDLNAPYVKEKVKRNGVTLAMLNDEKLYIVDRKAVHIVPDLTHRAHVQLIPIA